MKTTSSFQCMLTSPSECYAGAKAALSFKRILLITVAVFLLSSCSAVRVKPLDASLSVQQVCIEENPKVKIGNFLDILQDGFTRHGISTLVFLEDKPKSCEYTLKYTALRTVGITGAYVSYAELRIYKDDTQVASAKFKKKGGDAVWKSTKEKIDPMMDELLSNVSKKNPQ